MLLHTLEHSSTEKQALQQAAQWGTPVPEVYTNAPVLGAGLELYLEAFWQLHTCRTFGLGMGPIPWTSVVQWGTMQELDHDQMDDLESHISDMDGAFLKWAAEQKPKS